MQNQSSSTLTDSGDHLRFPSKLRFPVSWGYVTVPTKLLTSAALVPVAPESIIAAPSAMAKSSESEAQWEMVIPKMVRPPGPAQPTLPSSVALPQPMLETGDGHTFEREFGLSTLDTLNRSVFPLRAVGLGAIAAAAIGVTVWVLFGVRIL